MARLLLLCVLALATACTAPGPRRSAPIARAELLSTDDAARQAPPPVSRADAFHVDDDMRAFVAAQIGNADDSRTKLFRLLRGMDDYGLFSLEYATDETRTASEAFRERRGNCLSFTMLFVALAREAGLRVAYQVVDVPPEWSSTAGIVAVSTHINALVEPGHGADYIVDFNAYDTRNRYEARKVADDYALALLYNNLGVEALIRGDDALAFRYLRAAIDTHSGIPGLWTNLGYLYAREAQHRYADAAYLAALAEDPNDRSALTNLVSLHAALGNSDLAEAYRERIRGYQQRNPYYHYMLAEDAYRAQRYDEALASLKQALRLKRDEPQFRDLETRVEVARAAASPPPPPPPPPP